MLPCQEWLLLPSLQLLSQTLQFELFMDQMLCFVIVLVLLCSVAFCFVVVLCCVLFSVSLADSSFRLHSQNNLITGNFHIQFHNFHPNSVILKGQTLFHFLDYDYTKQPTFHNLHPSCFSIRNCKAMAASTMTGGSVSSVKQIRAASTAVARFLSSLKVMSPKLCNTQHA